MADIDWIGRFHKINVDRDFTLRGYYWMVLQLVASRLAAAMVLGPSFG